ncbi:MAG TPA: glutamate--tRNA ligase [Spirochaetia bacterium]|nr:MAG: glutamate--tRNA ligase [Spirochaetes bacterium GWE1_32_154]OHD48332.1 MAG: glutamate--tRNA ligase [Spirochaetes bacterium GWE2_31_10]HBI37602.1 glutamate--tRNA ligase [Spirochaetia bacterium]
MKVRVRYAPSPTGYQHIGGVRTALFNYLFAKANNGDFILRIEDTDQTRYFDGALDDIYQTFKWLGIEYDEGPDKNGPFGPYIQSERIALYKEYAEKLVETGHAYYCYCDSGRLERIKKIQEANKLPPGYDRHCRTLSAEEIEEKKQSGIQPVIRFKAPLDGKTSFEDTILGRIEVDNNTLQDFVLLKSDGFPTYHLANIIDDHFMEITHVLRAQEWIPSTPNHVLLYKAFGWDHPQFCHMPMVMGEDGKKLSKRHGATQVIEFRKAYLPEALLNFIALLGWSYNDKDEFFSLQELAKIFDIKRINSSPAIFDYKKLNYFNGSYIRKSSQEKIIGLILPYYIEAGLISKNPTKEELDYLHTIMPLVQERLELLTDAPLYSDFFFGDYPPYKTWEMIVPKNTEKSKIIEVLSMAKEMLEALGEKDDKELEAEIYSITEKLGVKAGAVFMPLRIAITGVNKSPELFPVMHILGKERSLKRIENAINKLKSEL